MIRFTLPEHPSTNALYANVPGKGRVKTGEYKAWINSAGWSLKEQKVKPISPGWYRMFISISARSGLDLDSVKAIPDLLQRYGIITNDKFAKRIEIDRDEAVPEGVVWVGLEACDECADSDG